MSNIFSGKTGLRTRYNEALVADLNAATSDSTAFLLSELKTDSKLVFFDNATNVDVAVLVVHPEADFTVAANRLKLIEVPASRVVNFDVGMSPSLIIPPGTKIYVYKVTGTASSGKFRLFVW